MRHYCKATSLPFEELMLTWEPGQVENWMSYKYVFKDTVMNSSGFMKPQENQQLAIQKTFQRGTRTHSTKLMLPYYKAMYSERLQL